MFGDQLLLSSFIPSFVPVFKIKRKRFKKALTIEVDIKRMFALAHFIIRIVKAICTRRKKHCCLNDASMFSNFSSIHQSRVNELHENNTKSFLISNL